MADPNDLPPRLTTRLDGYVYRRRLDARELIPAIGAGIVTGLLAFVLPIGWPWQVTIFGALALIIVIGWTAISRRRRPHTDQPFLNRRADRYLGHEGIIDEPIQDGAGRLVLDDTIWRITGPDLARGARVRVVGSDGPVLRVEAA